MAIIGALHTGHDSPVAVTVPLGLNGYVWLQLGQPEHPAKRLPALEYRILISPVSHVGHFPRLFLDVLLSHFGSIQQI